MGVKTGDFKNPRTSQIAAVSASRCYIAASLVAEHMWVFIIFGKEGNARAKNGRKVSANAVGGAQE